VATALHPASEQVSVSLKQAAKTGNNQIQIELNPASLGKIEVRLDFAHDGRISAVISADRPDTLQLLNHDAKALEQSLRDAGLRADSGSLTFNLRGGDAGTGQQQQFAQSSGGYGRSAALADDDASLAPLGAIAASASGRRHDGNLDIQV